MSCYMVENGQQDTSLICAPTLGKYAIANNLMCLHISMLTQSLAYMDTLDNTKHSRL